MAEQNQPSDQSIRTHIWLGSFFFLLFLAGTVFYAFTGKIDSSVRMIGTFSAGWIVGTSFLRIYDKRRSKGAVPTS